jgi:hypothetical protein
MSDTILVGAAEARITPPVGTELAGYFTTRVSEGVFSELMAKAVVAGPRPESGQSDDRVAIVVCDVICMPAELVARVRAIVSEALGMDPARIMVCATHTHTGPEMRGGAGRIIARNEQWYGGLADLIAGAVIEAAANARPAHMWMGREDERGLAYNRRFRLRDGQELFGPGADASLVAGVAGPTDPEMGVIKFSEQPNADPFALIVNYTVHIDVTGGNLISADFPAVMTEVLRGVYGPDTIVLFTQGASGNINHVPYMLDRPWPGKGLDKSRQLGRAFGGKALCIAEKALPGTDSSVDAIQTILQVPNYPIDDVVRDALEQARALPPERRDSVQKRLLELIDEYDPDARHSREVQTIRLGDAVFCSVPGEYFVEWGLEIKRWSPHPYTFIAELANDQVGYIPTWEAFRRGGYGTTPIVSVTSSPALGQMIADAHFVMLQQLWQRREATA